jgi:hypothetical protein
MLKWLQGYQLGLQSTSLEQNSRAAGSAVSLAMRPEWTSLGLRSIITGGSCLKGKGRWLSLFTFKPALELSTNQIPAGWCIWICGSLKSGANYSLEHFPLNLQHIQSCGSSWRIRWVGMR